MKIHDSLKTRLTDLVAHGVSKEGLEKIVAETGISGAELREAIEQLADGFDAKARAALKTVIGEVGATNPNLKRPSPGGLRAHDVKQPPKPWYALVKSDVGPLLYPEPARDVTVHGTKLTKDDVTSLLRSVGKS